MTYGRSYSTQSPASVRKAPIGYGAQYGLAYNGVDDPVAQGSLSEAERSELLQNLSNSAVSAGSYLLGGIDWLGARSREVLAGKDYGSAPDGLDVLGAHGITVGENALGGYGRPLAKFATEVATDPLTYTGFGALGGGLGKAGKAAKAVGILDDASRAMSRNVVDDIISGASRSEDLRGVGAQSRDFWAKEYGKDVTRLTDEDLYARPLTGWRESRRDQTLGDLLDRQRDWGQEHYDQTVENLQDYLYRQGGWRPNPTRQLNDLRGQRLASDIDFFGLGINLPGGGTMAKQLDRFGSWARWSPVGTRAAAMVSKPLHGAPDAGSQVATLALSRGDDAAEAVARRRSRQLIDILPRFQDATQDIRLGSAIRNVIEEVGPTLRGDDLVAHDEVLRALTDYRAGTATGDAARIGEFVDRWQEMSRDYLARSRQAGIGADELADKFGHGYFPRVLDDMTFGGSNQAPTGGRTFSVMTGDQMAREASFHVPGGTKTLQELSLDRMVSGPERLAATDDAAANYILQQTARKEAELSRAGRLPVDNNGNPATYNRQQALALARTLHKTSKESVDKGLPIFGMHPTEAINKYILGREKSIRRAGTLTNMIASSAMESSPRAGWYSGAAHAVGGKANDLPDVLNALGLKSTDRRDFMGPLPAGVPLTEGAKQNVLDRLREIGIKNGIPEFANAGYDALNGVAVDGRLLQRLNRVADYYQVPEVQSQLFKTLDAVTSMWKASVLSWPARFVRDWYSGMFSNTIEVGNLNDLMAGYSGAKHLLHGQEGELIRIVNRMPRYMRYATPEERLSAYLDDLAAQGISRGRQLDDIGTSVTNRQTSQGLRSELMAGPAPETTLGYQIWDTISGSKLMDKSASMRYLPERELLGLGSTLNPMKLPSNISQGLMGYWNTIKGIKPTETTNPILRWSARLGDTTDKINRIAGYNGLLLQGISPEEAAKRIMAAHVDYNSLTKFERGFMRNMLPFWAYQSRISKWVLTKIAEKPGGAYTQLGLRLPKRLSENDTQSDYVPRRISDKYGLSLEPIRKIPGLGGIVDAVAPQTTGISSWASDFDLPGIDQINQIKVKTDSEGKIKLASSLGHTIGSFAEGSHPLIKMAYEAGTGQDSYTGLKKNYARNTMPVIAERLGLLDPNQNYDTMSRLGGVDQALQFLMPFYSRTMQAARKGTDPRIQDPQAALLQNLINATAGVKIENIDDAEKQRDALETIKELLDAHPATRSYESTYIPAEMLPFVDEETQKMYLLDRQLRKERRQMSKVKPDVYNPMNY